MQAGLLFWGIAALVVAGCLAAVFAPLLRGGPPAARRASHDLQVHRDQLREVEADLARGVVTPSEAEATRTEIARRLLASAEAERGEAAAKPAPRRVTRAAAAGLMLAAGAAAVGLYAGLGAPGLRDQPLAVRQAREATARAERPGQAEAEAMVAANAPPPPPLAGEEAELVARLGQVLKDRPQDVEGHRLLARSLASLGRWPEARAAQERVVELLGDQATATDLVDLAEARILAAGGYVSPEAEAALARALALDPEDPVARYYSGLTLLQGGRPDLAHRVWSRLLAEAPPDAPWIEPLRAGVAEAARLAGLAPPQGPSAADVEAAGEMAAEDRQAMIEGMVSGLAERLASQGGPPEDWAQLIRSLGVLGRRDEAARVLAEARDTHAGDAAALAASEAAARDAGLAP
jgi:cytochrome c-type biogenesis protein CcmH